MVAMIALVAGCASKPNLPVGEQAYSIIPVPTTATASQPYLIGPLDILSINVFRVQSLSLEGVQVDAAGTIVYPLLGQVSAAGKTPNAFAAEIATKLREHYLVNPQVSVLVTKSTSQNVTVLGSVTEPGIYDLRGPTTLLDALALAKGTQRVAALDQVVIFRVIDGKRMGAMFDVRAIQRGEQADPQIHAKDTVVVGLNHLEAAWRDVLLAAPLAAVFTQLSVR